MKGWGITLSMIYRIIYKNFCRNTATRRERSAAAIVSGDSSGIGMSLSGEMVVVMVMMVVMVVVMVMGLMRLGAFIRVRSVTLR